MLAAFWEALRENDQGRLQGLTFTSEEARHLRGSHGPKLGEAWFL